MECSLPHHELPLLFFITHSLHVFRYELSITCFLVDARPWVVEICFLFEKSKRLWSKRRNWCEWYRLVPSLKLTACPWKWMIGRWNVLLGRPIFRGKLAVSFRDGIDSKVTKTISRGAILRQVRASSKIFVKRRQFCHKLEVKSSQVLIGNGSSKSSTF